MIVGTLALIAVMAPPAAVAEEAAALIEPIAVVEIPLDNSVGNAATGGKVLPDVTIPLRRRKDVTNLRATVTRVTVDGKSRPSLIPVFKPVDGEVGEALSLEVGFARLRAPASYGVTIRLTGKVSPGDAPTDASQAVELQFVLPAAKVRAMAPIVLSDPWYPFGDGINRTIDIEEISGTTRITALVVRQLEPAIHDGVESAARLEPTGAGAAAQALDPNHDLRVELKGLDFPVGSTKGQLTIRGNEIEQPVTVPFEVRRKVIDFAIVVVFALAGIAGWLVRHVLKNAEARAELRARLEPLMEKTRRQIAAHPDPQTKADLIDLATAVETALEGDDLAALQNKVNDLQTKLDAAFASRALLVASTLKDAAELERALTGEWDVPADVNLASGRAAAQGAEELLVAGDLDGAKQELARARAALAGVGDAATSWINRARLAVAAFSVDPPADDLPIPSSVRKEAVVAAGAASTKIAAVPAYDKAQPPPPASYLAAVHQARQHLRVLIGMVAAAFTREVDLAIDALGKAEKTDQAPNGVATQQGREAVAVAGKLPSLDGDPADALDLLARAIRGFAARLAPLLSAEAKKELVLGGYAQAVVKEFQLKSSQDLTLKIASRRQIVEAERGLQAPEARNVELPAGEVRVAFRPPALEPVVLARSKLRRIQTVRGIVSALLLSVGAWAIYRDSWVGTVKDFVGVAAVGFFTDFTIDALVDTVGKLRKT